MQSASQTTRRNLLSGLAILIAAALPACAGDQGPAGQSGVNGQDGTQGPSGQDGQDGQDGASVVVDPSLSPIDKAFAGIGGRDAIMALSTLTITSSGGRWAAGEGVLPEDPAVKASFFDLSLTADLTANSMRLDYMRHITFLGFDTMTQFSEIIAGNVGVIDGVEHLFGFPGGDMLSDRWASIRKQQQVLNPHLLLRDVAADPSLVLDDEGVALLDGSVHHLVVVDNAISPVTLWVNRTTGWINKLTFLENEPLHRDVEIEVLHYGWASAGTGGLRFPSDVYIALDGVIVHEERRTAIEVNPPVAAGTFDFPAGAAPMFSAGDASRGEANHQHHQIFASIGIPLDGEQTFVSPTEISPGVHLLAGGSHNSMLVEQANGLVLIEAPLDQARSEAILSWTQTTFPSKSITHVIATHHHTDHAAGVRTIVAGGAIPIVGEASAKYFKGIFAAPSVIYPDALETNPVAVSLMAVPEDGTITLPDATNTVTAYHIQNPHAADMLMIYVPSANVVFQSDLLNTGTPLAIFPPFMPNSLSLFQAIADVGLASPTLKIAGGHGAGTNTYAELQTALGL